MERMLIVLSWWMEDWKAYPRIVQKLKELTEVVQEELSR